jgi:hypothetical protein
MSESSLSMKVTSMDETPRYACLKCGIVFEHPETGKRVPCPKNEAHLTFRVDSEEFWNDRLTKEAIYLVFMPVLIVFIIAITISKVPIVVLGLFAILIPCHVLIYFEFSFLRKAYRLAWGRGFMDTIPMARRIVNYPDSNPSLESPSAPRPARPGPRPP